MSSERAEFIYNRLLDQIRKAPDLFGSGRVRTWWRALADSLAFGLGQEEAPEYVELAHDTSGPLPTVAVIAIGKRAIVTASLVLSPGSDPDYVPVTVRDFARVASVEVGATSSQGVPWPGVPQGIVRFDDGSELGLPLAGLWTEDPEGLQAAFRALLSR